MISREDKQEIVKSLMATRQKAIDIEIVLRFSGKADEAESMDEKERDLGRCIDRLIAELMDDWVSDNLSDSPVTFFKKRNAKLQRALRDLKSDLESAQKFGRVVSAFSDIVGLARGLLA